MRIVTEILKHNNWQKAWSCFLKDPNSVLISKDNGLSWEPCPKTDIKFWGIKPNWLLKITYAADDFDFRYSPTKYQLLDAVKKLRMLDNNWIWTITNIKQDFIELRWSYFECMSRAVPDFKIKYEDGIFTLFSEDIKPIKLSKNLEDTILALHTYTQDKYMKHNKGYIAF